MSGASRTERGQLGVTFGLLLKRAWVVGGLLLKRELDQKMVFFLWSAGF